jgi:hypothetical protein
MLEEEEGLFRDLTGRSKAAERQMWLGSKKWQR